MPRALFVSLLAVSFWCRLVGAWPADGKPICVAPGSQAAVVMIADGAGGAILVWQDNRDSSTTGWDLYAQRIDGSGAPFWPVDGIRITGPGNQTSPRLISDGAGGAIVAWVDARDFEATSYDVYVQRLTAAGHLLWTPDGVPLMTAAYEQRELVMATDGAGGAIVVWQDFGLGGGRLSARRVDATGTAQWPADGVALTPSVIGVQREAGIVSDGLGGAVIVWSDNRSHTFSAVYAQRLSGSGARLGGDNAIVVSTAGNHYPTIAHGNAGNFFIAWVDYRNLNQDIYAARMSPAGVVLDVSGIPICVQVAPQYAPFAIADGSSGAIIVWPDFRSPLWGVYGQRVTSLGGTVWAGQGARLIAGNSGAPTAIADGTGGAFVIAPVQMADYDIVAQRASAVGVPSWGGAGVFLCTAPGYQNAPVIVPDESGGALVAWEDPREGQGDIYVQRVSGSGTTAVLEGTSTSVSLTPARPNPTRQVAAVELRLAETTSVTARVFDLRGRAVRTLVEEAVFEPGIHSLTWDGAEDDGRAVGSGIYMIRVESGTTMRTAKVCVLR